MRSNVKMISIRYAEKTDENFWFSLDAHLNKDVFNAKIRDKQAYVLCEDKNRLVFCVTISFGTILRFAQCFLSFGTSRKKAMAKC